MNLVTRHPNPAHRDFRRALTDARNLIRTAQGANPNRGRRWHELALNRAAVVFAIAAWQSYVQDTTRAIVATLRPKPGAVGGVELHQLIKAATDGAAGRFNTPNAENSLMLFQNVGFDPSPAWSLTLGDPPITLTESQVRERLNQWLRVRHAIAHGAAVLPTVPVLTGVTKSGPSLRRRDAESCIDFIAALADATAAAAAAQFP